MTAYNLIRLALLIVVWCACVWAVVRIFRGSAPPQRELPPASEPDPTTDAFIDSWLIPERCDSENIAEATRSLARLWGVQPGAVIAIAVRNFVQRNSDSVQHARELESTQHLQDRIT